MFQNSRFKAFIVYELFKVNQQGVSFLPSDKVRFSENSTRFLNVLRDSSTKKENCVTYQYL